MDISIRRCCFAARTSPSPSVYLISLSVYCYHKTKLVYFLSFILFAIIYFLFISFFNFFFFVDETKDMLTEGQ